MCQWTVFTVAYSLRSAYTRPMSDLKTRPASIFLFQQRLVVNRFRRVDFTLLSGMLTILMNLAFTLRHSLVFHIDFFLTSCVVN